MPKKRAPPKTVDSILSSSEDEWEDVAETHAPGMNEKDMHIELELPDAISKKKSNKVEQAKEWISTLIKRAINKSAKDIQIRMHKTHLLSLVCVGMQLNRICCCEELQCLALSLLDSSHSDMFSDEVTKENLERLIAYINSKVSLEPTTNSRDKISSLANIKSKPDTLRLMFKTCIAENRIDLTLAFVLVLRSLGLNCRLVISFQPIPLKPLTEKQKQIKSKKVELELNRVKAKLLKNEGIPQLDGAVDDCVVSRRSLRIRKSVQENEQLNKENNTATQKKMNRTEKKQKKTVKRSSTETVSKYNFSGDETRSLSDENMPPAKKISALANLSKKSSKTSQKTKKVEKVMSKHFSTVNLDRDSDAFELSDDNAKKSSKKISNKSTSVEATRSKSTLKYKPDIEAGTDGDSNSAKRMKKATKKIASSAEESLQQGKSQLRKRTGGKNYTEKSDGEVSDESDADFDFDKEVFGKQYIKPKTNKKAKKAVSSNGKNSVKNRRTSRSDQPVNQWLEVYVPKIGWIVIDCFSGSIVDPKIMEQNASKPLHYVVAFDNDECIKDVTVRYASDWLITTRKLRVGSVDQQWWKKTLKPFDVTNQALEQEENEELELNLLSQPLPTSISSFKNHPLFALRRHLLKYEAIYPPDVPALGFVKGEEVLPRSSVQVLHTREKWLQQALSVRNGETPYKMVASYLLNKKLNRDSDAPSLALFGKWQTETYQPAVAENGIVPRNEYGNVDLFQPSMLPVGCVQLRLPSLNIVARKLNIDVATAIVGFDTHHGFPHPVTDGYVVCKEHEEILRDAWNQEQEHVEEKAREKLEKRVYSNWKTLIRGLLALEKVRKKYSKKEDAPESSEISHSAVNQVAWQAKRLKEDKLRSEQKGRRRRKKAN